MHTNKLINEKSPYLLQHSHNPVNWYPWGREAFEKAVNEDKPIFLSIGYSTCHWCHVMEKESFEDEDVAELLNKDYISIKVDREERPDIDAVYMSACQTMNGQGGWPLTIIMTPEQKPFFAATYIPKNRGYGSSGLTDILPEIADAWKNKKSRLIDTGNIIAKHLDSEDTTFGQKADRSIFKKALDYYESSYDEKFGGFGNAPKFPSPHNLLFLMKYYESTGNANALKMSEDTLISMYKGGICDHIGGGFSRYSTDRRWLIPHFEKMLYDNALLSYAYLEAYRITKDNFYLETAENIFKYVFCELTDENGGFFCGQDADTDGEEGKYYVFSKKEITDELGSEEGDRLSSFFNITEQGNFEGKNIPNLIGSKSFRNIPQDITESIKKLYRYRKDRCKLHRDDKILTSWNGLMIISLCRAYKVSGNKEYLYSAVKAESFISDCLAEGDILYSVFRDGKAYSDGKLDDYAFYISSLLELYSVTFDASYLKKAVKYEDYVCSHFFDNKAGGFYIYSDEGEQLILRPKEVYDGAVPSGNSCELDILNKLYRLTADVKWLKLRDKQLEYMSGYFENFPAAYSFALRACIDIFGETRELIYAAEDITDIQKLIELYNYDPDLIILVKTKRSQDVLEEISPFISEYKIAELPEYYFCEGSSCSAPQTDTEKIIQMLKSKHERKQK